MHSQLSKWGIWPKIRDSLLWGTGSSSCRAASFCSSEYRDSRCSGERIYSRWQFQKCLEQEAIQVIQPDVGNSGGITEVKKICDMAYTHDVGVQIHVCGSPLITAASLNLEATLPNFVIHEYNVNTSMPKNAEIDEIYVWTCWRKNDGSWFARYRKWNFRLCLFS